MSFVKNSTSFNCKNLPFSDWWAIHKDNMLFSSFLLCMALGQMTLGVWDLGKIFIIKWLIQLYISCSKGKTSKLILFCVKICFWIRGSMNDFRKDNTKDALQLDKCVSKC